MEIRQLRYFIAIAHHGSLTKAARVLGVAQPALSRHLKLLEDRLGVELFHRAQRGMMLTEDGTRVQERAEFILRELGQISAGGGSTSKGPSGLVVIGVTPSLAHALYCPVFAKVRALYPEIRLRLLADLTYDLEEWIHSGRIDLAVLTNPRLKSWLSLTDIARESLYLVTPPTDRKAKSSCDMSALRNRRMVLTTPNDIVRLALDAHARMKRVPLKIEAEAESIEATKQLVSRGLACTVLPFSAIYREFGRKELQISRIKGLEIRHVLAERADRPKSHAISEVAQVIMAEMGNLQKEGIIR